MLRSWHVQPSSTVSQQRFPCSNGCSLLFWTDKNQTHSFHLHFQAPENIKINELCTAGYILYLMSQVKRQDLRRRENWCTPAVQGTGQEMYDTSKNRHYETPSLSPQRVEKSRVPTHTVVWLHCPSDRLAVLATHMWNPKVEQPEATQGNSHLLNCHTNTWTTCLCVIKHRYLTLVLLNLKCSFATAINICFCHFHNFQFSIFHIFSSLVTVSVSPCCNGAHLFLLFGTLPS